MSPRWFLARRNLSRHFILKINSSALIVAKIKKQNKEFFCEDYLSLSPILLRILNPIFEKNLSCTMETPEFKTFVVEIKAMIQDAQYQALRSVNRYRIELYWSIG